MKTIHNFLQEGVAQTEPDYETAIIEFIKNNPNPPDDKIHELATKLNLAPDKFEELIYRLLTKLITERPGKHNDVSDDKFNPDQLKMGVGVEKEHSDSKPVRKAISKDHLKEIPDYYTRLNKMEDEAKNANESNKKIPTRK